MIEGIVELHNIEKIYYHKGIKGGLLQRIPEQVTDCLTRAAQVMMICPSGAEIRFVSDTYPVRVTLSVDKMADQVPDDLTEAHIFFGTFQSRDRFVIRRKKTDIEISMPKNFLRRAERISAGSPFSPRVCRIRLWGSTMGAPVRFHGIQGSGTIRPPRADELPVLRYMAYGTSLTQGAFATGPHLTYTGQVGYRLGADVINLGSGCSAHCEPEMADYIADRSDWDFATLALSVNMVDVFSPEEFKRRVQYMIDRVAQSNPKRPVACITIKPYYGDFLGSSRPEVYRQILRDTVHECGHENVYLIEGPDLMPDIPGGIGPDFIHLGDNGMIQIGEHLAARLVPILRSHGLIV